MSSSFTSKLKEIITLIEKHPNESMDIDLVIPYRLKQKMITYFKDLAIKKKNGNIIIHQEITSNRIEQTLKKILFKFLSIGVKYNSSKTLIEESVSYALKYVIENYPVHLVWSPINSGINYPNSSIKDIDEQISLTNFSPTSPWKELNYGIQNNLFFWTGKKWTITPLGNFFKTLSNPTGTVFLLMLENHLNVPEKKTPFNINPWHMSKVFLQKILNEKDISISIGDGEYDLIKSDPNMEFLNRLDDFQLVNIIDITKARREYYKDETSDLQVFTMCDDFFTIALTDFGEEILSKVLDQSPSILKEMIKNLIQFELSGSQYYETRNPATYDIILNMTKRNPKITGDQLHSIEEICLALKEGRENITIVRSLPPTIEKVLKNILIEFSLIERADSRISLGKILNIFEQQINNHDAIIKFDTLQYIKNIDRNSLMHGSVSPNGEIRSAIITLMINILIKIYEEYEMKKHNIIT